jgi:hypothetical protein
MEFSDFKFRGIPMDSLLVAFEGIEEPRVDRTKEYLIQEIFFSYSLGLFVAFKVRVA